jgi:hypothetical protein
MTVAPGPSLPERLYLVRVAQEVGRPQDMISMMKSILALSSHLDMEERVLFSRAYHDSIVLLRSNMAVIEPYLQCADTPEKRRPDPNHRNSLRYA